MIAHFQGKVNMGSEGDWLEYHPKPGLQIVTDIVNDVRYVFPSSGSLHLDQVHKGGDRRSLICLFLNGQLRYHQSILYLKEKSQFCEMYEYKFQTGS